MSDPYLIMLPWERENSDTPRADKIIREYLDKGDRNAEDTERDLHAPMQKLERELKALQSETTQSPQWIVLAERQPDEMQTCLVFPKEGEVGVDTWGYFEEGITHWMPMPEEPK